MAKGNPKRPHVLLPSVLEWRYTANILHPTQKPVGALMPLVMAFSQVGDIVLDPFAGSGSTAVAAELLDGTIWLLNSVRSIRGLRGSACAPARTARCSRTSRTLSPERERVFFCIGTRGGSIRPRSTSRIRLSNTGCHDSLTYSPLQPCTHPTMSVDSRAL